MELKLFTDLIVAPGKGAGGMKAIVNLPKAARETIRRTLDETYRLIDSTLNMVTIRLGDIHFQPTGDDFRSKSPGWATSAGGSWSIVFTRFQRDHNEGSGSTSSRGNPIYTSRIPIVLIATSFDVAVTGKTLAAHILAVAIYPFGTWAIPASCVATPMPMQTFGLRRFGDE